jgi:acyl-CoA synthetase (NDP forming)
MGRFDRLLRPKSILVVGGGAWGADVIAQCRKIGFQGDLWVVHPYKSDIGGLTPYRDLDALPGVPDATFIGVNRHATIDVVRTLCAMGAGGAICFASGFREAQQQDATGDDLQAALLDAAEQMPIIGPNCYGLLNYVDGATLWPDQHGGVRVDRGVALITQSSNIAINLTMQKRGLPIAYVVTVGNQAQTGFAEIGLALLDDPNVTALGLHIEGVGDLRAFEALADAARERGKPIVVLKVGQSQQAQVATVSHTASLAGSDAGARALFARLGIGQVSSLSVFLEAMKLLHIAGPLPSARVASMSCSGGEASIMADAAHGTDVCYPDLSARQQEVLRAALGPLVALANPLDYHTFIWGDEDAMAAAFTAMMNGDVAIGLVVLDFPRPDRCTSEAWGLVINAVARTQEATGKPVALLSSLVENMPEDVACQLVARGIVPFCGIPEAIEAIAVAAEIGQMRVTHAPVLLPQNAAQAGVTLTEAVAKDVLQQYGLPVPRAKRVMRLDQLAEAAEHVGFPVVLKGEGVAHKTEAGAVVLNLQDGAAVSAAGASMPCQSFLVEQMVQDVVAELLIGVVHDPAHGYVLTLAAGGTLTELLAERVSLLVPAQPQAIADALGSLKVSALLDGYRGGPAADRQAIVNAVVAIQSYVCANRPQEVEVNPLLCRPDGAIAADALIITGAGHD